MSLRRRTTRRLGCAAAFAVLAAAGAASAQQWTTTAIVVGRSPGSQQLFTDSQSQTLPAGAHNVASASINTAPGPADHPQAIVDVAAIVDPGRIEINGFTFLGSTRVRDDTLTAGVALVTGSDVLTIASTEGPGRLVTLHKTLELNTLFNDVFGGPSTDRGDPNGDFDGSMTSTLQISGTGIGPGKFGGAIFDISEERFGRGGVVHDHRTPATFVDFTFNFVLGQSQALFMTINLTDATELDDRDGSFFGSERISKGYRLSWLDGGSLTDAATGAAVCGVTSQSTSGFNYLAGIASSDCPVGGGGDDGGGGGSTSVPEPAAWALMIAGFGLTGAALRRRASLRPA